MSSLNAAVVVEKVQQVFRTGFWMKQTKVLHDVSLTIPRGAIFGFLGANGAGKTTLIHLMTGLRQPTSGKVTVFGEDAHSVHARAKIGYLPERPYFYDHLTGEGVLKFFGTLAGLSPAQIKSRMGHVLSVVGMTDARKVELRKYSKGMLQRIGIAQALIHDPELLILDEPVSGLDPLGRKEIRELILKLAGEGKTIFFSSHVIPDVEAICDQVAWIQKGKLLGCGPIGEFLSDGPLQTEIAFKVDSDIQNEAGLKKELQEYSKWKEFDSVRLMSEGLRGIVKSQDDVNHVLSKLLKQKTQVLWVTPVRPSLEDLFSRKTK